MAPCVQAQRAASYCRVGQVDKTRSLVGSALASGLARRCSAAAVGCAIVTRPLQLADTAPDKSRGSVANGRAGGVSVDPGGSVG